MKENMSVTVVGHVDHGKSTIIGRLLADTGSLPEGKLERVKQNCRKNAKPFEYAFLLDALKDEQQQGITIDSARCFFKTRKRKYIIIDSPGHIEFVKNMVTGASRAQAALLVIDAYEGIKENSRRHGYLLSMLGIKQICILVNKMDLVSYRKKAYEDIVREYKEFLSSIDLTSNCYIPVSGAAGDNIVSSSCRTKWYKGPTVLEALDLFDGEAPLKDKAFRMPVQGVYKFTKDGDSRRIIAGTILTGKISAGDEVFFYPSGKKSKVKSIEEFGRKNVTSASAGHAAGFTLTEQIYVKRGEIAAVKDKPRVSTRIKAGIFWLGKKPMETNKRYLLKLGTAKSGMFIERIDKIMDTSQLTYKKKKRIDRHDAAECIIKTEKALAFDISRDISDTGRFVIVDGYDICGGGIIKEALEEVPENIVWNEGKISYEERCRQLRQKGIVVWFTGLSGAGKSTIAAELEAELFGRGKIVYRLDGDNVRYFLNSDLSFSKSHRNENIRRLAEIAALFKDAGIITLVSAISPYREMRDFARRKVGKKEFVEVYVKASLKTCEKRDTKGLYKKARNGEIKDFTGISAPYEEPDKAEIVINTEKIEAGEAVDMILEYLRYDI